MPTPDIDGFIERLSEFQDDFARDITFTFNGAVTFPPGTAIDPETTKPYDPVIAASASAAPTTETIPALILFPSLAPGTEDSEITPIGRIETGQVALVIDSGDWDDSLAAADSVEVLGESYGIVRTDQDAIADRPPHRRIVIIQQL